jgi:hypothetical protein
MFTQNASMLSACLPACLQLLPKGAHQCKGRVLPRGIRCGQWGVLSIPGTSLHRSGQPLYQDLLQGSYDLSPKLLLPKQTAHVLRHERCTSMRQLGRHHQNVLRCKQCVHARWQLLSQSTVLARHSCSAAQMLQARTEAAAGWHLCGRHRLQATQHHLPIAPKPAAWGLLPSQGLPACVPTPAPWHE